MNILALIVPLIATALVSCGSDYPDRNQYQDGSPATVHKVETKSKGEAPISQTPPSGSEIVKESTEPGTKESTPSPPVVIPPPAPPAPAPSKMPIRTIASATEITTAKTQYATDCSNCHQALANSRKKGVTLVRINAAGVAGRVQQHSNLINGGKWPKDTVDSNDDGVDTAVLNASAIVEALK